MLRLCVCRVYASRYPRRETAGDQADVAGSLIRTGEFGLSTETRHSPGCPLRFEEKITDRPLDDLNRFSTTIATKINDLPVTSPHGSDFNAVRKFLELHRFERSKRHSNGAHRDGGLRQPRKPSTFGQ